MFTPNPNRTFEKDVTIYWPREDGTTASGQARGVFQSFPQEVVEEWADEGRPNSEVLGDVLKGAKQIGDGQGGEMDPAEAVPVVIADPCSCSAFAKTYFEAVLGGNRRRKTSRPR